MQIDQVLRSGLYLDGIPLSVADNQHLLRWPGEWLGFEGPFSTHSQKMPYFEASLSQQKYDHITSTTVPLGRRVPDPLPVPEKSGKDWRDTLADPPSRAVTYPELSPWRPGFARPSGAVAAQARQNVIYQVAYERNIPHPFPEFLEQLKDPFLVDLVDPDGAAWILGILSQQMLNAQLIRPDVVEILTPAGAGQALHRYLLADRSEDEIRSFVFRIKAQSLSPMINHVDRQGTAISKEMAAWRDAVRIPVVKVTGQPDPVFTLVNLATAETAIRLLGSLRDQLFAFKSAAIQALQGAEN